MATDPVPALVCYNTTVQDNCHSPGERIGRLAAEIMYVYETLPRTYINLGSRN